MPQSLKAFLSHRYQSPDVNTYFHQVFSEVAELQFEVDEGRRDTNVTRLERMIRDTDAFVGIYPLEWEGAATPTPAALLEASRYFRLEVDLAARARTPSIVFVDKRLLAVIKPSRSMFACPFDYNEVVGQATGRGGSPNRQRFRDEFERFCRNVDQSMSYERTRPDLTTRPVALALPPQAYAAGVIDGLEQQLVEAGLEVDRIAWPPRLDGRTVDRLQSADWVVTDVGAVDGGGGLAAYLHGQAIPVLRLVRLPDQAPEASSNAGPVTSLTPQEALLYSAYDSGYPKDIVRWSTPDQLATEFKRRLDRIIEAGRPIRGTHEAVEYFLEAAKLKEHVFLSYSGDDKDAIAPIADELRRRFQSVFDYRDGARSIEPGKPWVETIFRKLDRSNVAIMMLSPTYVASGNCMHEAQNIVALHDGGKLEIVSFKVTEGDLTLPPFLSSLQYASKRDYKTAREIVDRIVELVRARAASADNAAKGAQG